MDDPLKALEELGEQFERAEREDGAPRRRRRPRRALLLAVPGTLVVVAAAAAAATQILTGEPVRNPRGVTFKADRGLGKPVLATTKLLGLRVADPGGGPPWGMRTLRTTRGLGCVQIGRVVDGKLGVLGQDGAFADDGRFHELPADVLTHAHCQQPDGAGHVFLAISYQGMPGSAMAGACRLSGAGARPRTSRQPEQPPCRASDERILYVGLLGPRGKGVTYEDGDGRRATAAAEGPDGGYLVVLRPSAKRPAIGRFVPTATPVSGLVSVQYVGAPDCRIHSPRSLGGAKACPARGYVAPRTPRVTSADVLTPVRASIEPRTVKPPGPAPPAGVHVPRQWKLHVAFRARRRSDAQTLYFITLRPQPGPRCRFVSFGSVDHDVRAGEVVRQTEYLPAQCRGTVRGTVVYRPQPSGPEQVPYPGGRGRQAVVGRFAVEIPR